MEPPKLNVRLVSDDDDARDNEAEASFYSPSDETATDASFARESANDSAPAPAIAHAPARELVAPLSNITNLPSADRREKLRILEALLFAASEPLDEAHLATHLKEGVDVRALLDELRGFYAGRGINLVRVAGKWAFRTAQDLGWLLERHAVEERRLSKAALETLAIVSYHQPVTRAEIEEIRGVETSKGTLDILLETGWIRPRGRRRAPGKPLTYGTTDAFLEHFSLDSIKDLPGLNELKGAGLLDANLPPGFTVPSPNDIAKLMPDELPLEDEPDTQEELDLDGSDAEPGDEATASSADDDPATAH